MYYREQKTITIKTKKMNTNHYTKEEVVNFIGSNPGQVDVWGVNSTSSDAEKIECLLNKKIEAFDIRYYPNTRSYMVFSMKVMN